MFWYTRWRAKDFNILSRRSLWKHEADTEVIEEGNPSTLIDGEEKTVATTMMRIMEAMAIINPNN